MICNTWMVGGFVFSLSVLILNLPTSLTISLTWFSFFFSPLSILRNTRSETGTNRNTRRPWTCHLPSSFPTLWSQTRWGHSFTPLLCRIVTGKVKYCCRAGWLHCVLNNFCYFSSLSFTHPDIFSPISNWHYFDNCLSLFRCFSLVPVLPFHSTIIRLFLPFCFPPQTYNSGSSGGGVTSLPASSQKRLDDGTARFTNANFQEVSSTHSSSSSKDGLAADSGKAVPEVKNKKNSGGSHAVGQRGGRKSLTSSGKPLPSAVVTMATSSTSASASTGPFHQGELMAANGPVC